ncbi:phospholipase D alpha 1-like [Vigna unguiculata]|uniref:phospholipase D alpha 1-like n=1 Tax=Vigna unguiculata TaxID=3917 RepID=UPI001016A787|nr:phospholipase D alpha 1-like [Vigna unguiculata]
MPELLHGILKVTIFEVDRLHTGCHLDFCQKGTTHKGKRFLAQVKGCLLCRPEIVGTRLYATVDLDKARVGRTRMIGNQPSNPKWNESFEIYSAHRISNIIFTVKDGNPIGATLIGRAYVPVEQVRKGPIIKRWVEILDEEDHRPVPGHSKIRVSVQFTSVTQDPTCSWSQGIRMPFSGVPRTFFNQREGCHVTLYQDAHAPRGVGVVPYIPISEGKDYLPARCWEDIYTAIMDAKHFVYITGWSVYTEIALVRDKEESNITLGELLKKKADEGVRVLLLIWNDRTSVPELTKDGLMGTHDKETAAYFRNTKVHCVLCPRNPDDGKSMIQELQISTMFTHHQKSVVVDAGFVGPSQKRRSVVSFIGGLDLCDGRYDTRDHPLFSTLNTVHRNDFHQPNFPNASIDKGGPREPWHDIHCKLEGPIAWDVLYNFEQRWEKQVGKEHLFSLDDLDGILVHPSDSQKSEVGVEDTWNVQLFRSIDGGAALGFPQAPEEVAELGLVSGKDNMIERSIQDAYINAIRRAKNFVYIENQYFLGSSYAWHPTNEFVIENVGALHLIPKELTLKIVSKIEAKERFSVYIVIPMWPEGVPESESVQAILDWQRRTMEMMYSEIAEALVKFGIQAHPRDYLTFFCLGNREHKEPGEYTPPQEPEPESDYRRAQNSRRFMIYVHSKMMIVDDEYIIVGSANINQRSMEGSRDSEIAMGAFQPRHLAWNGRPRGEIYRFRRALWYEHLGDHGFDSKIFDNPEHLDCIGLVNRLAEENWDMYSKETFDEPTKFHHLMRYPIHVAHDGTITSLRFEHFPDTKARILGSYSYFLPSILTT